MRAFDWKGLVVPEWPPWEVAFRATVVYLGVQLLLRLAGRKELGRYASFDVAILVLVTTAMRQTLVGTDTSLTSAFVALGTMILLDTTLSRLAARRNKLARVLEGEPIPLVRDGQLLEANLRQAHLSEAELMSWARQRGVGRLADIGEAFLEPSGRVSVIPRSAAR
jgi:uncharacterized membrane protein YcaP (DUF421 family)